MIIKRRNFDFHTKKVKRIDYLQADDTWGFLITAKRFPDIDSAEKHLRGLTYQYVDLKIPEIYEYEFEILDDNYEGE